MIIDFRYGGIIPTLAADFHRANIEQVVADTFTKANLQIEDIDAIAVTSRPGLIQSLLTGLRYAKHLSRKHAKPIIPIHHMQGHALTARLEHDVEFPFLCLLASGGHCLLTFVESAEKFYLLGESIDNAPGEVFDKISRQLLLRNLPQFSNCSGGAAMELAARNAENPDRFAVSLPMAHYRNCQFSFSGFQNEAKRHINRVMKAEKLKPDEVMRHYEDFCASLLRGMTRHICHRTQRAMEFCERKGLFKGDQTRSLVFSGGVAANDFIFTALKQLGEQFDYKTYRPSKRFCTDNGVMIAWNGIERWQSNQEAYENLNIDEIIAENAIPIGESFIKEVEKAQITFKIAKLPILQGK